MIPNLEEEMQGENDVRLSDKKNPMCCVVQETKESGNDQPFDWAGLEVQWY
jgi:hypothetical protein